MAVHIRNLKELANLNKDLVLGGPPLMVKDHTFALFNFGTLPIVNIFENGLAGPSDVIVIRNVTVFTPL